MIFYKFSWKPSWRFVGNKKLVEIIIFKNKFFIRLLIYFQIFVFWFSQLLYKIWT